MKNEGVTRFDEAIAPVTSRVREVLAKVPEQMKEQSQEIRLRQGKPLMLVGLFGVCFVGKNGRVSQLSPEFALTVTELDVNDTLNRLCSFSVYSHQASLAQGFVTFGRGFRAGISGTAVQDNSPAGGVKSVRDVRSINIRIAREHVGAADKLVELLFRDSLKNIILAGAPASGKTTMLRDLSRQLSSGTVGNYYKVVLIDERAELAGAVTGEGGNDVGLCCDVLTGFPKAEAIVQAVRTLSPQYIICDEIGTLGEVEAIAQGIHSGVKFALSIHAGSRGELLARPQVRRLLSLSAFEFAVLLKNSEQPCEIEEIWNLDDCNETNIGGSPGYDFIRAHRSALIKRNAYKSDGA